MKILMIASEMAPLVKTGGLADVLGALPAALARRGHDVAVALPFYSRIDRDRFEAELVFPEIVVDLPAGKRALALWTARVDGVKVLLIEDDALFDRPELYAEGGREYPDNALRFGYFCAAALWAVKGLGWIPDILHAHDWQAAYAPIALRRIEPFRSDPALAGIRTLFSIHNLSYQGVFPAHNAALLGIPASAMHPGGLEYWGKLNLLKGGLLDSDWLSTVSPTYAKEIQTPEFGCGLEDLIAERAASLTGILNGIDAEEWNPATDPHIPAHFSALIPEGKAVCKARLQERLGLPVRPRTPLLGIVSRLVDQKGFDLLAEVLPVLLEEDVQLAVLGTGQPEYHAFFEGLAASHPDKAGVRLAFDNGLSHQIEAGADIFLMPSRFEPCGLNQMYSLRYGTIPVVRRTGGLADTIADADAGSLAAGTATGFVFEQYTAPALAEAIDRALALFTKDPAVWKSLMRTAMTRDHTWLAAAGEYEELMAELSAKRSA